MKATGLLAAVVLVAWSAGTAAGAGLDVAASQNTKTVPRWDIFEVTLRHDGAVKDPFADVTIEVVFTSPGGRAYTVGGFHYGSTTPTQIRRKEMPAGHQGRRVEVEYVLGKPNLWKARFAPNEVGRWTYAWTFADATGNQAAGRGAVECIQGRRPLHGFVRQDPRSPMRWVFDDGTPYHPIGLQDGWFDNPGVGSVLSQASLEGPFRTDRKDLAASPAGALFRRGPAPNPQNADAQFRRFAACGFNMMRFSQHNFSYTISHNLDHVGTHESVMTDELLARMRAYGLRVFYGIFGYMKVANDHPDDAEAMAKVKRQIKYHVDRWGAYVDFWEFLNEQNAKDEWYAQMAPYLKSIDPYHHPVTTSWERPHLKDIDLSAPHAYLGLGEDGAAGGMAGMCTGWKKPGKPVIVGETGNVVDAKRMGELAAKGIGGVWDPGSALRMRLRNWAAFFNEVSLVFWNTSYARDGHFMNIWLGPREREYVRAMQSFAYALGAGLRMVPVEVTPHADARAWGLANDRRAGVYLEHPKDHATPLEGIKVTLDVPCPAKAYWYSPETAAILATTDAPSGRHTFAAPAFAIDLALLITPDSPPDVDGDGIPNDRDPDDDNDGTPDAKDAFPLDPSEWADADGDLIGDNIDADVDADGKGDDRNGNGTPDCEELDIDGDGVPRSGAVPWDAFPLDPKECRDTDGDGTGDNADTDDDGDGWTDDEEKTAGTDPLDRLSFPAK
ncbi:MAG TPA: DUF5060 domain-containing protein [Phycisphaerae bacterium]|nr:DUF5060 domain-containing protein [Phycisphaerae bacterium]